MANEVALPSPDGKDFAVHRHVWPRICDLGMNPAIAHLVLARFSGSDQQTTSASVNAIEKYPGISRNTARLSIDTLKQKGSISRPEGISRRKIKVPTQGKSRDIEDWIWQPNSIVDGATEEIPPIELLRQTTDFRPLRIFIELYHSQSLANDGGIHLSDSSGL